MYTLVLYSIETCSAKTKTPFNTPRGQRETFPPSLPSLYQHHSIHYKTTALTGQRETGLNYAIRFAGTLAILSAESTDCFA